MFKRDHSHKRPQHLLCQGYEWASPTSTYGHDTTTTVAGIPGVIHRFDNHHVNRITSPAWCQLLSLLGHGGELIMIDLLIECDLFIVAGSDTHHLVQLSGNTDDGDTLYA